MNRDEQADAQSGRPEMIGGVLIVMWAVLALQGQLIFWRAIKPGPFDVYPILSSEWWLIYLGFFAYICLFAAVILGIARGARWALVSISVLLAFWLTIMALYWLKGPDPLRFVDFAGSGIGLTLIGLPLLLALLQPGGRDWFRRQSTPASIEDQSAGTGTRR